MNFNHCGNNPFYTYHFIAQEISFGICIIWRMNLKYSLCVYYFRKEHANGVKKTPSFAHIMSLMSSIMDLAKSNANMARPLLTPRRWLWCACSTLWFLFFYMILFNHIFWILEGLGRDQSSSIVSMCSSPWILKQLSTMDLNWRCVGSTHIICFLLHNRPWHPLASLGIP